MAQVEVDQYHSTSRVMPRPTTGNTFAGESASPVPFPSLFVSQETLIMAERMNPQAMPIIALPSKPSNPQPVASTSNAIASSIVEIAAKPAKPSNDNAELKSTNPSVQELAKLGIKVRDFGHESTLPPVRPYVRRQIQPDPLKRERQDEAGRDDAGGDPAKKKSKLERTVTEPDIPETEPPSRARGFADLRLFYSPADFRAAHYLGGGFSQPTEWASPSQSQPPLEFESQESEPCVATPLVTPEGSSQWQVKDTSSIPASQLDTNSQQTSPELLSYSQVGFHNTDSDDSPLRPTSPLTPPHDYMSSRLPSPDATNNSSGNTSPSPHNVPDFASLPHVPSPPSAPRYLLRTRPSRPSPTKAAPKTKPRGQANKPAPRSPKKLSIQSAQSQSTKPASSSRVAPRARTVRTRRGVGGGEDMIS